MKRLASAVMLAYLFLVQPVAASEIKVTCGGLRTALSKIEVATTLKQLDDAIVEAGGNGIDQKMLDDLFKGDIKIAREDVKAEIVSLKAYIGCDK